MKKCANSWKQGQACPVRLRRNHDSPAWGEPRDTHWASNRTRAGNGPLGLRHLEGYLSLPTAAIGLVVFAHGSGSSRHSPRNRYVADILNEGSLGTLLIDLLNADEQEVDLQTSQLRFDIPFLANRLVAITQWLRKQPQVARLRIGYFGASTGAAAALVAAAELPRLIHAVVSRGGRPDLAGDALERVALLP